MKQQDIIRVLQAPVISEKGSRLAEQEKCFVFRVRKASTKGHIKRAVEMMFNVKVDSVHVLNVKGKIKRAGRFIGERSDWKKAYIKLKPGFDIELAAP
ncbi:MAG TPA: 50S ribosomal protein L23 [Methylococcaceae bacterium]|jgi:large subunit ribosomal protein L23|nr:50S ribosomal protein L23 [Methylococcaceae bacterium]